MDFCRYWTQRDAVADSRASVRINACDRRLSSDVEVDQRVGTQRLDKRYGDWNASAFIRHDSKMLRSYSEHCFAASQDPRRIYLAQWYRLVGASKDDTPPSGWIVKKFIVGEPMKPATN